MSPVEAVDLVALVAGACPSMRMEPSTPDVWYRLLADIDITDAIAAVEHLAKTQPYIAVSHIREAVRAARAERINRGYPKLEPPPADAATYRTEFHTRIARLAAAKDVHSALTAPEPGVPCPPDLRDATATVRVTALLVACPWCRATPGEPCVVPGTRQRLSHSGVHDSRIQASQEG